MPRYQTKAPVFDHGVSPRELADQPAAPWYNHRNEPTWSDDFSFISAARIRDFLSDNLDENADHFVFFTTAGTVLGHDNSHEFAKCRRFAACAGFTFRVHDEAFARTGKPSSNKTINDGMFNGKVLKFIITKESKKLRAMIVEQEGVISVVVYCTQRTLMAAQLEKAKFGGELTDAGDDAGDDLAKKVRHLDVKEGDAMSKDADKEGEATAVAAQTEDAADSASDVKKGKEPEKGAEPTKMQILQWRAEGMAESLAEDELEHFIMPPDFR